MVLLLGLTIISFLLTSLLLVPFIDLLFNLRKKYFKSQDSEAVVEAIRKSDSDTPIHDQLMKADFGTPHGGGIIIIPLVVVFSFLVLWWRHSLESEWLLIALTMLSFGALGLIDDIRHIAQSRAGKFKGLPTRVIFSVQLILATIIAISLHFNFGFNNLYLPILGNVILGVWYIPLAVLAIMSFANGVNISDGLDGLSSGLLTICLVAFLVLAHSVFDVTIGVMVGIWLGALIAYLYFNVFPARVYLGDAGAFGFGATLAVIGLLTGKIFALGIIGGMFMVILLSSFAQIMSKRFWGKKIFPVAPLHMYFKYIGWPEPKVAVRFWLAGAMCAVFGLWLGLFAK